MKRLFTLTIGLLLALPMLALAQQTRRVEYVRIQNKENPEQYIHCENGKPEVGEIEPDWWSAQWEFLALPNPYNGTRGPQGQTMYVLRNRWKPKQSLNFNDNSANMGPTSYSNSRYWFYLEPAGGGYYRIRSGLQNTSGFHMNTGSLRLGYVREEWENALWKLTVAEAVQEPDVY